jgi:hypothetical protein
VTLESLIASVRRRWRARVLFRGGLAVLAALLVALAVTALGLEATRFSAGAVLTFRWMAWSAVTLALLWFVVRPLFRRVSDEQVALYLEEHEPSLKASVLGALQARGSEELPPELAEALVHRAVEGARQVEYGRRVDGPAILQAGSAFTLLTVVTLGLLLFGPLGLRRGAGALLPGRDAASVNPYSILVTPGDLTIARGSDQFIEAELVGFSSPEVSLFTLRDGGEPNRLAMLPRSVLSQDQDPGWEVLLVGLENSVRYFVESDGIRSATHTITVVDLPYVDRMDHTYVFPAFTGLPARTVEGAGDVAALAGTRVEISVQSTLPAPAGRLVVDGGEPVALDPKADGGFSGSFTVTERGFYRIELALDDGTWVEASPEYTIDVLSDQPPSVDLTLPGRDTPASPIEELYLEAEAVDDYGVGQLLLVYSVNGQPEDTVRLYAHGSATPLTDVTAGHTLYLEDFEVVPGDLVSYYAVARDLRSGAGEEVVSDIYFVNVQPFRRDFREAEQQGGSPQGSGAPGAREEALSDLQRQVIAATFNLVRDADRYSESELEESLTAVALAQERVREQVATLAERMTNRGLTSAEDDFREIAEMLPEAVERMTEAAEALRAGDPRGALPPEQQSLSTLQKAEETYERYVGQQQAQQSGGQGQGANADDLADLFELELDQLQNQYETVQRGERQDANEEVDEVLERLRELSQRQQQEAERQRARAARQGSASAGGGSAAESQRELADETEEAARQLQQLARQTGDRELAETARELQEAADAMRRAAANAGSSGPAEARSALDRLEEARRRLQEDRETRLEEDAGRALREVREMRQRQAEIQRELDDLPPGGEERREAIRDLVDEKGEMAQDMLQLRQDLTRLSQEAQRQDPEAARALRDAADLIEEEKIAEKIQYSRGVVEMRDPAFARIGEEEIEANLEALEAAVETAAAAAERVAEQEGLSETLDRARELQDRMASLDRRLNARAGQSGEPGQAGDAGQSGEAGQAGEAARAGNPGQAGGQGGLGGQQQPGQRPGDPSGGGMAGSGAPLSPEEIRQYQRELQQRLGEAAELRDQLRAQGQETGDLEAAIQAMESLRQGAALSDFPQVEILQEAIRESLGRVEFSLRRQVRGDAQPSALGGSEAVPESFRRMVEEYYRSLARERGGS